MRVRIKLNCVTHACYFRKHCGRNNNFIPYAIDIYNEEGIFPIFHNSFDRPNHTAYITTIRKKDFCAFHIYFIAIAKMLYEYRFFLSSLPITAYKKENPDKD